MGELARDTTVTGGAGRYGARLAPDWSFLTPNGGYLASIALRAAAAEISDVGLAPASLMCHFLGVASPDAEVDLVVEPLRLARRARSVRVRMSEGERPIVEQLVWFVDEVPGIEHDFSAMPDVPAPEALPEPPPATMFASFWGNFEARPLDLPTGGRWEDRSGGPPLWRSWYRFREDPLPADPVVDTCRAVVLLDTLFYGAALMAHPGRDDVFAPSLDLAVRFHRRPPYSEWLYVQTNSPTAVGGLVTGFGAVWAQDGGLVASGGQQMLCQLPAQARP
ncbi:MAG TPA: thioesterase family protein [Mycobacteriales bacterium]|nr:thioesterase family protein [Mycobacteriales bacterium]